MARLFLALWPDDAVRASLAQWRDAWHWPGAASPVRTGQLHLTLHFIGTVDTARVQPLADALALPFTPFELRFGHPELWHHGIAVLEPDHTPPALTQLHAGLGEALAANGLPPEERAFRPHVTLARRAAKATLPAAGPPLRWRVNSYALMLSSLHPDGGGYSIVREYR
jgi:2'-5' RNA ligase